MKKNYKFAGDIYTALIAAGIEHDKALSIIRNTKDSDVVDAEMAKIKYGEWTINTDGFTPDYRCSCCNYNMPMIVGAKNHMRNYCPNCGAKMI